VLHVDVQEPSVTKLPQSHVKIAPSVGAVQALAVQVGFVDDVVPAGQDAVVAAPE
jgi:hypothetical protein